MTKNWYLKKAAMTAAAAPSIDEDPQTSAKKAIAKSPLGSGTWTMSSHTAPA